MTNLFSGEGLPPVSFESLSQYRAIRNDIVYKLGLDLAGFEDYNEQQETSRRS